MVVDANFSIRVSETRNGVRVFAFIAIQKPSVSMRPPSVPTRSTRIVHHRDDSAEHHRRNVTSVGQLDRLDDVDDGAVDDPVRMGLGLAGVDEVLRAGLLDVAGHPVQAELQVVVDVTGRHRPRRVVDVAGGG